MSMFCFQCEQTARGSACTVSGVCGKKPDVAAEQDVMVAKLIELSRAVVKNGPTPESDRLVMEGLFTTITNVNFDQPTIVQLNDEILAEAVKIGGGEPYDASQIFAGAPEDIISLRSTLLFGLKGMAAYAHHAWVLGYSERKLLDWMYYGLAEMVKDHSVDEWLGLLMEFGQINLETMALLDKANTETYGTPVPTPVTTSVEAGPFIIVTGHDLKDLDQLLKQSEGKGVNIYTHGEMLPCHSYPELKKYSHLKGNFGTAWFAQQTEFDGVPAPILYTTNCIMPPKDSYVDRIYTTSVVQYPGTKHIPADASGNKDFTALIDQALALGGYSEPHAMTGMNGGGTMTPGFGHGTILSLADTVVNAVKAGDIKHFFLVGGCDGARGGRSYYTDFVKATPADTVVLTLACGKFRFNDLDLGQIGGLPRIMDMGQCNDAYGAIQVAVALANAFECGVNDLPLTLVLSWYEQKAVCILLTLLSLGIKNIYLGPTLPAFLSGNVLGVLVEKFDLHPLTTPEADLRAILG